MILSILILLAFAWLLKETDFLRIRLPVGMDKPTRYARYRVYQALKDKKNPHGFTHSGGNVPETLPDDYSREIPDYALRLSPGVDNILCGWEWLDKHVGDLVDYQPKVFLNVGNVRYNMTVKQPSVLAEVMKVNKLSRSEKARLAEVL